MKKMKLVMVGNGMAGVRTLEELLKIAPDLYDITRLRRRAAPELQPHPAQPGAGRRADGRRDHPQPAVLVRRATASPLHLGKKVVDVDRRRRVVKAADGTEEEYDRLLIATGSNPFILPVPGKDLAGVIAYRDIADTNTMIEAADQVQARGRDRRRPARAGSGQRPDAARHAGHRRAHHAVADGAPARRRGRQAAAAVARGPRPEVHDRRADAGPDRRQGRPGHGRAVQGRQRDPGRPGRDGRRHPPQHRTGREDRPALQPRHRRQRHDADHHRPAHLLGRRMRRAPRHRLRPGGAAVRAGQGLRDAPGRVRHRPLHRQPDQHQAEGHRHRSVLRRRLHRRRGLRGDRDERSLRRRLQEAGHQGRQAGRRLPVRRHRRRLVVLQAAARRPQGPRHPRQADVRRIEHRRHRPRRPHQGRRDGRQRRGVRLQRRQQGHDLQGHQGQGPVHARRGAQAHQGQRELRLVHRPGRAAADVHRRRRLLQGADQEGHVRLHRRQPPGGARGDQGRAPADASTASTSAWAGARPTAAPRAGRRSTTT